MSYTATIQETGMPAVALELRKAPDGWRWYETASGNDTEVSSRTQRGAIAAARSAWRNWRVRIRKG